MFHYFFVDPIKPLNFKLDQFDRSEIQNRSHLLLAWSYLKISSDKKDRGLEVEKAKSNFTKNDYPSEVIRKETETFLKNRVNKNTEEPKNFIESNFTNLELKVVFVAPLEMRNLFKFKDKVTDKFKQSLSNQLFQLQKFLHR